MEPEAILLAVTVPIIVGLMSWVGILLRSARNNRGQEGNPSLATIDEKLNHLAAMDAKLNQIVLVSTQNNGLLQELMKRRS